MKPIEFIKEVQKSEHYYEGFENQYANFQDYQRLALDTLREFCLVCDKGHINYQLAFGSLLGAVRDGGQIPWDYDVDVFVPASERNELLKVLNRDLNTGYYFYSIEHDDSCGHVILRIAPKGYDTRFLHVDVFFIAGVPNDCKEAAKYKKDICELVFLFKAKRFNFKDRGTNSKREAMKMLCYKLKGLFKSEKTIWDEYLKLSVKYPIDKVDACCSADRWSIYNFPSTMMLNTMMLETEEGIFRIPKEYHTILSNIYGDYKSVPSLKNRIVEFKRHCSFLLENCPLEERQ